MTVQPASLKTLKKGEIELSSADGVTSRILTSNVVDLSSNNSQVLCEKLRLGPETGVTLYQNANFSGTSQEVVADLPNFSKTKLKISPRSIKLWSTVGKTFKGNKWAILAPNNQYLSFSNGRMASSPKITAAELFDFPKVTDGVALSQNLKHLICYPVQETEGYRHFWLQDISKNEWLSYDSKTNLICWVEEVYKQSVFTQILKIADAENQVGELLPGEAAFYENPAYWGKTWILYNGIPDFTAIEGLDDNVSSIRLAPQTGATLYRNKNYSSEDRKDEIQDIVENVFDLGESQIKDNMLSSVKIWSNIRPEQANVSLSTSMSQDYKLVGEELQEFSSYRTILRFLPEVKEVEVWATDLTEIEVDGKLHEVDEDRSTKLHPNGMNRLMITSEAKGINTPGLKIRTDKMQSHERIVIFPDRKVHQQVAKLEDGALWDAKDAQGNSLVNQKSYTKEQVADVQRTITNTMATVKYVLPEIESKRSLDRTISADAINEPWKLSFRAKKPSPVSPPAPSGAGAKKPSPVPSPAPVSILKIELKQHEFESLLNQSSQPLAQSWWDNFCEGLKNAIESAVDVVVGVINNVVTVVITTVEKVITTVENVIKQVGKTVEKVGEDVEKSVAWIIDTAEKVGVFVEAVVEKIGIKAKELVEYLRSVFDWKDILSTQNTLADALEMMLEKQSVDTMIAAGKSAVGGFMGDLRGTVKDSINTTIKKLGGDQSELGKSGPDLPEQAEWFLSKLMGGGGESQENSSAIPLNPVSVDTSDPLVSFISDLLKELEDVVGIFETSLKGLSETIDALVKNPYSPQLAIIAILKMVRDILDQFLTIIEKIANSFLAILGKVIEKFCESITTEINIPFFTGLFKMIGAGKLTLLRLGSLLIAIPVTVTSKLLLGREPSFEAKMAQSADGASTTGWTFASLFAGIMGGILSAALDLVPEGKNPTLQLSKRKSSVLSTASIEKLSAVLSVMSWLASFPKSPNFKGGRPYRIALPCHAVSKTKNPVEYWQRVMWGWRTAVLGLDLLFTVVPSPSNLSKERLKRGTSATTIFFALLSCVDLGLTSTYLSYNSGTDISQRENDSTISSELFGIFPSIFGFLRVPPVPPLGLPALAFLDVACASVGFGIGMSELGAKS